MNNTARALIIPDEKAEQDFYDAIDRGLDDIKEGRLFTPEEVLAEMYQKIDDIFDGKG